MPHNDAPDTTLDLALTYISKDTPIFPCRAKEEYDDVTGEIFAPKTPLTPNGLHGATTNERIVREWWKRYPDAMVGAPTGSRMGAFVVDVDNKPGGANGFDWLAECEAEFGPLPHTKRVKTPNGGLHIFFTYVPGTRNRGALGAGVDVRSEGGYVVAAGSVMADGRRYEWEDPDAPIADAPPWLLALVLPKSAPARVDAPRAHANERYVETSVQRELDDLASEPMGNRNNALNDAAFSIGTFVGAGGLSESDARALLQDVARSWGRDWPRCVKTIENGLKAGMQHPRHIPEPAVQPVDTTTLANIDRIIKNGMKKAEAKASKEPKTIYDNVSDDGGDTGNDITTAEDLQNTTEQPEAEHDEQPTDDQPTDEPAFRATPFSWIDPATLPRREFAFGTHYIRKYVSVTVSPGGLGKTSLSVAEALSMASGKPLLGIKPPKRMKVWLFNAEDPRDEMERRIMAACVHYGLKPADLTDHLFLDTGREQELVIIREDKKTGLKINEPVVEAIAEQIKGLGIDVMIVDPFVSTHGVNENDNGAIDKVTKLWAQIADYTNCAIDIVHHLKKIADREATVEDSRGAVSLIGAARSVRVLNRMTQEQATKAGLDGDERLSYFWVHQGKSNLTKMDNKQHWRKLESVPLGNGRGMTKPQDFAGVVTAWEWPSKDDVAATVPEDVRREVLVKLANQNCRESAQSDDWAGYVLADAMGAHLETGRAMTAEKRRIKTVLDSWIENGILAVVDEPDPKHVGRNVKYVRPAQ